MSPRDRILARRAKFLAAATAASVGVACSSSAEACLSPLPRPDTGAEAQVCLEPQFDAGQDTRDAADSVPMPCLTAPEDTASADTSDTSDSASDTSVADTFPMPCLVPPLDSGS